MKPFTFAFAIFGLIVFVLVQQLHIEYLESRINDLEITMEDHDRVNAINTIYLYSAIGDFK